MRLPGIEYDRPTQGLGRESVSRLLDASSQKIRAVQTALRVPYEAVRDQYEEFQQRQLEIGQETAALGMAEAESSFTDKHMRRNTYTAEELPDYLEVPKTREAVGPDGEIIEVPRTDIPAYEVRADMYKDFMSKQIQIQSNYIPEGRERDSWIAARKLDLENNYGRLVAAGVVEQKKVIQDQRVARYKLFSNEQKFDHARAVVERMDITPEEKAVYFREIAVDEETNQYKMSHANQDAALMRQQLDFLLDPEYREKGGLLTDDQRDVYATHLRRGISGLRSKSGVQDKVEKSLFSSDLSRARSMLKDGHVLPPDSLLSLQARGAGYPEKAGAIREVEDLHQAQSEILGMIGSNFNFSEMETAIQRQIGYAQKSGNLQDISRAHAQQAMLDRMKSMYKSNPAGYAEQYLNVELTPITPQNLNKTGGERMALFNALRSQFGYADTLFKPEEKAQMVDYINNGGVAERMQLAQSFQVAFGNDAGAVMEDLTNEGAARAFLVAGDAMMRGNPGAAQLIFKGMDEVKEDPNYLKGASLEIEAAAVDALGTTYRDNVMMERAHLQSIKLAYAALAKSEGVVQGVYDSGLMKKAASVVTGNKVHDFSGHMIELPPNMTSEGFDDWMDRTHHTYMNNWKLKDGYSSKKVWNGIQSGSIKMRSIGPGRYHLIEPTGQAIFDYSVKGDPYPLVFTLDRNQIDQATYNAANPGEAKKARGRERRVEASRRLIQKDPTLNYERERLRMLRDRE